MKLPTYYKAFGMTMLMAPLVTSCTGMGRTEPNTRVEGAPKSVKTNLLEAGANILQTDAPTDQLNIYLVGFHPMKSNPSEQFEAHHFCQQVNEDFAQCALYDGNTEQANMTGIEYIISEKLFKRLPAGEDQYWHPHNGEILSGQLVAPNLPDIAEHELMKGKMNSYGKTWHTWNTSPDTEGTNQLPLGEPVLAWSFNRFGEPKPGLVEDRDERMDIDTEERRRRRQDLLPLAKPQVGVEALEGKFPRETQAIPGVEDKSRGTQEQ